VFWDELFVFPVLNLSLPELSRSLMEYRYHRLPAARRAAAMAGHAGAMFPWQSGSDGTEQSALVHLNPQSGRWLPDTSYLQRHVGIAVAYNAWQYYQSTGDRDFLARYGAEIILEIARFFASIASYDREQDRYVIRGVVGPDEFHTSYLESPVPGIDNNAYTNVMTVWLLLRAREVLGLLPEHRRVELTQTLGLTAAELERWEHICRRMYVPFHDVGIISQFEATRSWRRSAGRTTTPGTGTSGDWTGSSRRRGIARTGTGSPSRRTCSCCSTCCRPKSWAH
jgi:trehalose/maltose hydrolase-like predicted phosphorylase